MDQVGENARRAAVTRGDLETEMFCQTAPEREFCALMTMLVIVTSSGLVTESSSQAVFPLPGPALGCSPSGQMLADQASKRIVITACQPESAGPARWSLS